MCFLSRSVTAAGFFILLSLTANFAVAAQSGDTEAYRTWTNDTGKHRVEAAFVGLEADGVRLKKKDGNEIVVPLARLSAADQEFVRGQRAEPPGHAAGPPGDSRRDGEKPKSTAKSRSCPFVIQKTKISRDPVIGHGFEIRAPKGKVLLIVTIEFTDEPYDWTTEEYCKLEICDAAKRGTRIGIYGKLIGFGDFQIRLKDGTLVPCHPWATNRSSSLPVSWSKGEISYVLYGPDGKLINKEQSSEIKKLAQTAKIGSEKGWLSFMARSTDVIALVAPADEPVAVIWGG